MITMSVRDPAPPFPASTPLGGLADWMDAVVTFVLRGGTQLFYRISPRLCVSALKKP